MTYAPRLFPLSVLHSLDMAQRAEALVRKTVTVLFCDVTGFTSLGERMDPETMRRVMIRYFDEVRTVLERHGGTVEKFIGDAVMALFGAPIAHEDDPERAVRAAFAVLNALAELAPQAAERHGITLQARIGVESGEVVTGDPFGGSTMATGDCLNLAARLEEHAGPGAAPALSGPTVSAPPASMRAIDPPPAPIVWMSSAGRRIGNPPTERCGAGSGTPPRTRQTSVLVPPMSNATASG